MIKKLFQLYLFRKKWRKLNPNNYTVPIQIFPKDIVRVGKMTYGSLDVYQWGASNEKLIIGNYVSIATGVKFLLGGNHLVESVSTYPFKVMVKNEKQEAWSKGKITIEDDVWIGMDAMILSGVTIGKGAIVAARGVITKDVPPYAIVAGNPAKIIKYRFSEDLINRLMDFEFLNISENYIINNIELFYTKLNHEVLDELMKGSISEH